MKAHPLQRQEWSDRQSCRHIQLSWLPPQYLDSDIPRRNGSSVPSLPPATPAVRVTLNVLGAVRLRVLVDFCCPFHVSVHDVGVVRKLDHSDAAHTPRVAGEQIQCNRLALHALDRYVDAE